MVAPGRSTTWSAAGDEHRDEQAGHEQVLEEGGVLRGLVSSVPELCDEQPLDEERRGDDGNPADHKEAPGDEPWELRAAVSRERDEDHDIREGPDQIHPRL
jgi:hypothetical protein